VIGGNQTMSLNAFIPKVTSSLILCPFYALQAARLKKDQIMPIAVSKRQNPCN